jgi:hypothetical protein
MIHHLMTVHWPDEVDQVLDGDHVVMLAYATPAKGAVLLPVSNFALRDREAGTVSAVNSSVGAWRKLDRIRRDPHVALAFHTRTHAMSARPEYVLVQGRASLGPPVPDYPSTILRNWERFEPWGDLHPLWRRWRRVYALRVAIEVAVERTVVWPDLACRGEPVVHGAPLPAAPPAPQRTPTGGTGPRVDHERAASRAGRLPDVLVGWIGADGFPVALPAGVAGTEERGIVLGVPAGLVPPGGRRAGLTAHWFSRRVIGQTLRRHTGWLEAGPAAGQVLYAPHTDGGYRFPASWPLFQLVSGAATRWGVRGARRAGFMP